MITTTKGLMDETLLRKKEGSETTDQGGLLNWVEYWDGEDLVHRSVEIVLTGVEMQIIGETLGG